MMWLVAVCLFLGVIWLSQALPVIGYAVRLRKGGGGAQETITQWPRVHLFMGVRGGGEQFRQALALLPQLDYPCFHVSIVIDHPTDPAVAILESMRERLTGVSWDAQFLRDHAAPRSLLVSAFVQLFEELDSTCELLAFFDADMHLPPRFLRDLAAAMQDPGVGTTLGNRWYRPAQGNWGSLVRYLWNAGAVVPMWLGEVPWSGAAALRPADVRRSKLLDDWKRSMVEDAPIKTALQRIGLRCTFVPTLIVVEESDISLPDCFQFIKRQLLWTRLYHPAWPLVVLNAAAFSGAMFLPWVAAIVAAALRKFDLAAGYLAAGGAYWVGQALLLAILEQAVMRVVRGNGQQFPRPSWTRAARVLLAIPLAQVVYWAALWRAQTMRRVSWSGVHYQIHGPYDIRVTHYAPVQPDAPAAYPVDHRFGPGALNTTHP